MSTERTSRPFTARSVILSVLLGTEPPRLPVGLLVGTTELFGITDNTTRTALSRMSSAGEVRADDGWYEIASPRLLSGSVPTTSPTRRPSSTTCSGSAPSPDADPAELAARLWDLDAWRATAEGLDERIRPSASPARRRRPNGARRGLRALGRRAAPLPGRPAPPPPAPVRPSWPGDALRANYERYDAAYRTVLRTWFDEHR
jgi:phenylacetic acid degradation operon negative regulatory protein